MFDFLRKVFDGSRRPVKIADMEAHLVSADGGLHGDAEFSAYDNGFWEFEVEVEHPGRTLEGPLDVRVNGRSVMSLTPRMNETEGKLRSDRDQDLAAFPELGDQVEVYGPNGLIASGVFQPDR